MQVARLNMSLDVTNEILKEKASVQCVHLSNVLYNYLNKFLLIILKLSSYDFALLKMAYSLFSCYCGYLKHNGSNGIKICDVVTYCVQILSDHLGIR